MNWRRLICVVAALAFAGTWIAAADGQPDVTIIKKKIDPNDPNQPLIIKPGTRPATRPVKKKVEPRVSPTAMAELTRITEAYKKLKSLELSGTLSAQIDIGGQKESHSAKFTGQFQAPNKFRHEMTEQGPEADSMLVGSTGESVFIFRPGTREYASVAAPSDRGPSSKLPRPMRQVLEQQDPGLMCAIVDDAGAFLVEDTLEVNGPVDVKVNGKPHLALDFKGEKSAYRVIVSPSTYLVRQVVLDLKATIEAAGRTDVKTFTLTFDYARTTPDARLNADAFAWSAPDGAREVAVASAPRGGLNGGDDDDGEMLTTAAGQDAPEFTLKDLEGKEVALKDHKGAVIVLDFWATWCGPCRASLPGLNKIYNELKGKGLVVYAIDLKEPKDKVKAAAGEMGLDIPVLLDEQSAVAGKYGVNGIPHTVVIGKDLKIARVIVGAGNEAKIRAAVEAAMEAR